MRRARSAYGWQRQHALDAFRGAYFQFPERTHGSRLAVTLDQNVFLAGSLQNLGQDNRAPHPPYEVWFLVSGASARAPETKNQTSRLPEISPLHPLIRRQFRRRAAEHDFAGLQHVAAVSDGQGDVGVLFDHEHADALVVHLFDDLDRKSTRLNSSHVAISYAVFCLKKKMTDSTVQLVPLQQLQVD